MPLRNLRRLGKERIELGGVGSYAGLSLLAIFAITVLTNVDVVLAKHYLAPTDAGSYAIISVLGRIAFYAPIGIALAMFPKTSESFENGGNHQRLFFRAGSLTLIVVVIICVIYALFPDTVIRFLFSDKYALVAPHLFRYGLGMSFFALSYLAMSYFLSLGKTMVAYPLLAVMFLQVGLIGLLHSSIAQLVNIMLICGSVSLVLMFPFFLKRRTS